MELLNGKQPVKEDRIRVLLVDDSLIALTLLKRMLDGSPEVNVVGTASNGKEALRLIPALDPQVICSDIHMPVMDGIEFTKRVMEEFPKPVLVVSVSTDRQEGKNIFKMMEAGAVDFFQKPKSGLESDYLKQSSELITRIKVLSGVHVFKRIQQLQQAQPPGHVELGQMKGGVCSRIVAIGASTGGPQALAGILSSLPAEFPLPVICVQHIGEGFLDGLVEWLRTLCRVKIEIARPGEAPAPGTVYFPRENTHLLIDSGGRFENSIDPANNGHRPSVTVTFSSVARYYRSYAIGVLLTGMGNDGADGMKAIADAGGMTIAQDESTSVVFSMPKRAIDLGAAKLVLPVDKIADAIVKSACAQSRQEVPYGKR